MISNCQPFIEIKVLGRNRPVLLSLKFAWILSNLIVLSRNQKNLKKAWSHHGTVNTSMATKHNGCSDCFRKWKYIKIKITWMSKPRSQTILTLLEREMLHWKPCALCTVNLSWALMVFNWKCIKKGYEAISQIIYKCNSTISHVRPDLFKTDTKIIQSCETSS